MPIRLCQFHDALPADVGKFGFLATRITHSMRNPHYLKTILKAALCLVSLLILAKTAAAQDYIDPLNARFTVAGQRVSSLSDVGVDISFSVHSDAPGKIMGSKMLCRQKVEDVRVTDDQGRALDFTVQEGPRQKIIWEYPPPRDGVRKMHLQFVIKKGVRVNANGSVIEIDWLGGWSRQVRNAFVRLELPGFVSRDDIRAAYPQGYVFDTGPGGSTVTYSFPNMSNQSVKVVLEKSPPANDTRQAASSAAGPQTDEPALMLENIRFGSRDKSTDRLVFDLNRTVPFRVKHYPAKQEIEITWSQTPAVSSKAKSVKQVEMRCVSGLYWKKDSGPGGGLAAVIQLRSGGHVVQYGALENPPRVFIDVLSQTQAAKAPAVTNSEKKASLKLQAAAPTPESSSEVHEAAPAPQAAEQPLPSTTTTAAAVVNDGTKIKSPPIEEKIAFLKAQKQVQENDSLGAIDAYEKMLRKYPQTQYKEEILFAIADSTFSLAVQKGQKYWSEAVEACRNAILHFPNSDKAPLANFHIAECYRLQKLYLEAKNWYVLLIQQFPDNPLAVDAKYWIAECLYQMKKYKEALEKFELFLDNVPKSPHLKDASFRRADCYARLKDFDRAEFYFEKALKRWPELLDLPMDTMTNLGMMYYYRGRFKKCRSVLLLSYNIYPQQEGRAKLLRYIGDAYQWEGNMQGALKIYGHLVMSYPEAPEGMLGAMRMADLGINVDGLHASAVRFQGFNPYLEPEKAYRWVIEHDLSGSLLAESLYKLGFSLAKKGSDAEAVTYFKRAMFRGKDGMYYGKSFQNIQKILVRMIRHAVAEGNYFETVEIYKQHADTFLRPVQERDFMYFVGLAYLELGFLDDAALVFRDVLQQDISQETRQRSKLGLGRVELERGALGQAEEQFSLLLYGAEKPLADVAGQAFHLLGDTYYLGRQYLPAIEAYAEALRDPVGSPRTVMSLLRIGEALGNAGYYYSGVMYLKRMLSMADHIGVDAGRTGVSKDDVRLLMADFLYRAKYYTLAAEMYKIVSASAEEGDSKGWACIRSGDALSKTGAWQKALDAFSQAKQQLPFGFYADLAQSRIDALTWEQSVKPDLNQFL